MGNYRRKAMGMGRTPLQKVETTTAGVVLFPNSQPTAPVLTTPAYVPAVTNNWWQNIGNYVPKAIEIATPFVNNAFNRNQGYQTPGYSPQIPPPPGYPNANNNDNGKGLGDWLSENKVVAGVGALLVAGLGYMAFKK